ncbi:putative transmembrane protein [Rubrivivax sp. A210]|uniref:hypothetical protein n=1 Tax=Rubrivivax sp. A210 TaxID=2772301 RepID=UPI00191AF50E|nr:hypothetical protein [Rubrivivax sp. A210]CAD5373346.1 putative transmembrane protein [Rubrivivax sp. A210]
MSPTVQAAAPVITSLRARLNQLQAGWSAWLGWPGLVALGLLLGAVLLAAAVRPSLAPVRGAAPRAAVDTVAAQARAVRAAADAREQARAALPSVAQRGASIARLVGLLERAQVGADSADYTAEDVEPGLVRLHIAVPFKGGYPALRRLVASVLNAMPHAALDGTTIEKDADEGLSGHLRFSLFFRREAP